ncbi:LON peptidase N-terminal domain and RING finger protein 1-like isoform X2 [Stegostoma tigrinum]|uniref:LON peptidase N-terminal domain and RING finger protein 1-like isoform X2 n=1 Tax=Stegostoma tigrinum TaxID=3053191 RepID=UPI0028701C73|nr:LON peptidase N-terminal domain and RING finger protein 1-like isoform X2 [Stegostoma tigrinum]
MEPVPGRMLSCPLCCRQLREPVTAACGHSLCRRCERRSRGCPVCLEPLGDGLQGTRVNVLASGLLHKWFPEEGQPSPVTESGERPISQSQQNLSLAATDCLQKEQATLTQDDSSEKYLIFQPMARQATNELSEESTHISGSDEDNVPYSFHCLQSVPPGLLNISDFECSVCARLLFEPVTTPCGHTFCKKCVERCLDYRPCCPLCKEDLRKQRQYRVTQLLDSLITMYFPAEFTERKRLSEIEIAELSNLTNDIPIFVCTMAFPGISCRLHIFEPRYRLMMRRCLETGTKTFGMCIYDRGKIFADYGCMLKIEESESLPDGRSLVNTVGGRRFKVLRRGDRDGYNTADVEYLEDKRVDGIQLTDLCILHSRVYEQARNWFDQLPSILQGQIRSEHGPIPDREENVQASPDGPRWCWWVLAVLPMEPGLQMMLLSSTSLQHRLMHLQRALHYLVQNQIM